MGGQAAISLLEGLGVEPDAHLTVVDQIVFSIMVPRRSDPMYVRQPLGSV
jgi:hypothetical protein